MATSRFYVHPIQVENISHLFILPDVRLRLPSFAVLQQSTYDTDHYV